MLKQQLKLALSLFLIFTLIMVSKAESLDYIKKHSQLAINEMQVSGIPASIKLAQAILESAWGRSDAATLYNSHFGIKCKDWRGDSFRKVDDDYDAQGNLIKSCFRAYLNTEQSFKDHSEFLTNSARYRVLFTYDKTDYVNWAIGLQQCGYATNKEYAIKLIDLIEEYKLYQYDRIIEQPNVIVTTPSYRNDETVTIAPPTAVTIPMQYNRLNATENENTSTLNNSSTEVNATSNEHSLTVTNQKIEAPSTMEAIPHAEANRKVIMTFRPTYGNRYEHLTRKPRVSNARRR